MSGRYPFPSPKRSPSIVSLLNPSPGTEGPQSGSSGHDDPNDYFSNGNYFQEEPEEVDEVKGKNGHGSADKEALASVSPGGGGGSRDGSSYSNGGGSSSGPSGFKHLLSPSEPTPPPLPKVDASEPTKRKRPRVTELLHPTKDEAGGPEEEQQNGHQGATGSDMPPPRKKPAGTDPPAPSSSTAPIPSPPVAANPVAQAPPPPARNPSDSQHSDLEPSIFNVAPIDEFTKEVADWLWGFGGQQDWNVLEIEAKIGVLIDTNARTRVNFPVPTETILMNADGLRFESNMTVNQHKSYNKLLNSLVENTASPSYPSAPIRYAHTRETDSFHQGPGGRKVRLTKGAKDGDRCVEKVRVADMNIFCPKRGFDWRLSVSLEMPANTPTSPPTGQRHKDRISYSHQMFQVDLTQVTTPTDNPAKPVTHELEVEFKDARVLMREAQKEEQGQENRYLDMVQCFLNNIRMLIRNAAEPH